MGQEANMVWRNVCGAEGKNLVLPCVALFGAV
jgi:hypothetical protein